MYASVVCSSDSIFGSATFTTEESMNAMLDPSTHAASLPVELSYSHLPLRIDYFSLRRGQRRCLLELLLYFLGLALRLVRHTLLLGDLPIGERFHELIGRHDVADQC